MKKKEYLQIRTDKAFKLLLFAYCKKNKKSFTDFFSEVLYFYFNVNDLLDIYKYREELYRLEESGASDDFLNSKAEYFVKELTK